MAGGNPGPKQLHTSFRKGRDASAALAHELKQLNQAKAAPKEHTLEFMIHDNKDDCQCDADSDDRLGKDDLHTMASCP